jgi:hypothetical protein
LEREPEGTTEIVLPVAFGLEEASRRPREWVPIAVFIARVDARSRPPSTPKS